MVDVWGMNSMLPPWFHGLISREDADVLFTPMTKVGVFLVREKENKEGFVISVQRNSTSRLHYPIKRVVEKKR